MLSFTHGLISRSSSTTLSAHPQDIHDGTSDDITIAQGLLNRPRVPMRISSFTTSSLRRGDLGKTQGQDGSSETNEQGRSRRAIRTSNTWTSSSGEVLSDRDDVEDRTVLVEEYNQLAKKHGVRIIVPDDYEVIDGANDSGRPGTWFSRKILRRTSSTQSIRSERHMKNRRSISESLRLKAKRDKLKDKNLQELVRLCGSSLLYLPAEYACASLAVPTCFRATAQFLVQHATTTRGVFRISGSHQIVGALYNHYCIVDAEGDAIASTIRCPSLPEHIKCDVHDVASAFKRFLSGLPGGILGSLPLFDALIAIQGQLHGDPEMTRTKQSKVRARLIALAIGTVRSQYRRELICAVFGLLSMIGRTAEITPREDGRGRPLPTSDLMGYAALGIVFGPLLVGDLLDNYTMHVANPLGALILLPVSPPKSRKEKHKKRHSTEEGANFHTQVDKVKVANSITEMLITHWRDVVRHMRNMSSLNIVGGSRSLAIRGSRSSVLRPSASETFALRKPPDWDDTKSPIRRDRSESPTPMRHISNGNENQANNYTGRDPNDSLVIRKQRLRPRPLSTTKSRSILTPTLEENSTAEWCSKPEAKDTLDLTANTPDKENKQPIPPPAPPLPPQPEPSNFARSILDKNLPQTEGEITGHKPSIQRIHIVATPWEVVDLANPTKEKFIDGQNNLSEPLQFGSTKDVARNSPKSHDKHRKEATKVSTKGKSHRTPEHREIFSNLFGSGRPSDTLTKHNKLQKSSQRSGKETSSQEEYQSGSLYHTSPSNRRGAPHQLTKLSQDQHSPVIAISRASPAIPNGAVSGHLRRIAASEPYCPAELQVAPARRVSKTTFGDRKTKIAQATHYRVINTDPLTRVSQEEDLASLAALARALDEEERRMAEGAGPGTSKGLDQSVSDHHTNDKGTKRPSSSMENNPALSSDFNSSALLGLDPFEVQFDNSTNASAVHRRSSLESKSSKQTATAKPTITAKLSYQSIVSRDIVGTPPGGVRALAAKFNKPESISDFNSSDKRSPSKASYKEARGNLKQAQRDIVVAPYTTNTPTPSPTKSQKSSKSEKTPQSTRNSLQFEEPPQIEAIPNAEAEATQVKISPLHRISKSSLDDSTTFRQARKLFEETSRVSAEFKVNSNNPYTLPLKHVVLSAPMVVPTGAGFDGPASISSLGTILQAPDPPPVAQHVALPRPLFTISTAHESTETGEFGNLVPLRDVSTASPAVIDSSLSLTRSSSVLHTQIRTLQSRLSKKDDEIRKLRQQLDTKNTFDIGTLSEQLRIAKREVEIWKTRAEVAEKQVEMFTKLQSVSRSASGRYTKDTTNTDHKIERLSTEYDDGGSKMAARVRRALKDLDSLDGAASSEHWNSEMSNETVIRDIGDVTTRSDFSIWLEQTNAVNTRFGELE